MAKFVIPTILNQNNGVKVDIVLHGHTGHPITWLLESVEKIAMEPWLQGNTSDYPLEYYCDQMSCQHIQSTTII